MAGEDCRWPTILEEKARCRRGCHAPSRTMRVKQGKNTIPVRVAHGHQTWWRCSAAANAPPKVGGVTPDALEVGVSNKHPTTLLLSSVIPKIL